MKFYIHPINPHFSSTYADHFAEGLRFGIWEYPYPARESSQYRFGSDNLDVARELQRQAEVAAGVLPDIRLKGEWLALPSGVDPHSDTASKAVMSVAAREKRPVRWPWTETHSEAA